MDARKVVEHLEWIHGTLEDLIEKDIRDWHEKRDVQPERDERMGKLAKAYALLEEIWDELDDVLASAPPRTPQAVIPTVEMLEAWKAAAQA